MKGFTAIGTGVAVGFIATTATAGIEIVGPFTITDAPDSASLIAGGGGSWGWLNVANVFTSVNDAFSGFNIIDDGYANGPTGTTVEVVFNGGVTNVAGDDLVMFDSRFSLNDYSIATDFDGFFSSIALNNTAFIDTGVDRTFFYDGNGPFAADVMGAAFDLSSLGVPANGVVNAIRFTAVSDQIDPLGIGVLGIPAPGAAAVLAGALIGVRRRRRG